MKFRPIPKYADLMELQDFIIAVRQGSFIDYDGHGYYATASEMSDIIIVPSMIEEGKVDYSFSHVAWFDR